MRPGIILRSALLLVALGCVDGPFARHNPSDPANELELAIVGGVDTLRTAGQQMTLQVVSRPPISGYIVHWRSSDPGRLFSYGNGNFQVSSVMPTMPVTVTVSAQLGRLGTVDDPAPTVTRTFHIVP